MRLSVWRYDALDWACCFSTDCGDGSAGGGGAKGRLTVGLIDHFSRCHLAARRLIDSGVYC